jgi:hypothetical protein
MQRGMGEVEDREKSEVQKGIMGQGLTTVYRLKSLSM